MNLVAAREGVQIAIDALRSNKVRASLTILGIVIGVATVMAMAAVITGVRSSITEQLEGMGPQNFVVERFDETQIRFADDRFLDFPQIRWSLSHMRELVPTVNVWRGTGPATLFHDARTAGSWSMPAG